MNHRTERISRRAPRSARGSSPKKRLGEKNLSAGYGDDSGMGYGEGKFIVIERAAEEGRGKFLSPDFFHESSVASGF